jgi:outer membrane lipoprotein-sorting protein
MYKSKLIVFVLMLLFFQGRAQLSGFSPIADMPDFRMKFMEAAKNTKSIRSDFTQEKNMSMLAEKITSKGKFSFKQSDKVRMEYLTPFKYLMIINGSKVYIRDGQKESTISTGSNKIFRQISQIMLDCVSGAVLNNKDFKIRVLENKANYLIEMTPLAKGLKEYFKTIYVTSDKSDYSVSKVEMIELSGDNTILNFINKEINSELPEALFSLH